MRGKLHRKKSCVEKDFVITRFVNICWYFFKLAALLAVFVAVGLTIFLFTRLDDEIRRQAEQFLAREFPQFNVSIGGARLVEGQGIAIYDLTISETSSTRLQSNLVVVDEIMLSCDAQLTKLVKGLPEVSRVVVRHPQVWAAKNRNGSWNFSSLLPLPECNKKRPEVVIENAQITLVDQSRPGLPALSLKDVNLTVRGDADAKPGATLLIEGAFGGSLVERAEVQARCDPEQQSLQLACQFEQLQLSKGLLAWVAAFSGKQLDQTTLLGKVDGEVKVEHQFAKGLQPRIEAKFHLREARLEDPRLPRPLVDLSCVVQYQNDLLSIEQLRGTCGTASVALRLQRRGWKKTAPWTVGLSVKNITLDQEVYRAMPAILKTEWDKFLPKGIVDAEVQATFDGKKYMPIVKLTGRELQFESDKFRYRVKNGSGSMSYTLRDDFRPATLDINLVGYAGGQPLRFVGQAFDPRPGALGWVEITGSNLEIEDRMIAALPEKARRVIDAINPHGKFNFYWRLDRTQLGQIKPNTTLSLELVDCHVNYEKFPYPLSSIQGFVEAKNQHWTFRNLVSGGSRHVECEGYLRPGSRGNELLLSFKGIQLPLDDDLRQALPPAARQAWLALHPRGNVNLRADVSHVTGLAKPVISVVVHPLKASTTIQPKFFPYLMEQIEGSVSYQDGKVQLSNMRASHGQTEIRTNGDGHFREDGSWNVRLEGLAVDRLMARRTLTDALPPKLRKLIEYLKPSGAFSLSNGMLSFAKARGANATVDADWDVELNCVQANLQTGIELHNVHGAIRLKGFSRGEQSVTAGELAIDTATFQDIQFTEIHGPLWVDQGQCLFGSGATRRQGLPLRRIQAKVYDGDVIADVDVSLDVVPQYSAIAMLTGASMQRLMKERINGQLDYQGKLAATLTLNGKGRSLATLAGYGEVQITEANIYELPILVSMLSVLRNETPESTAFKQVDSKFRIQGQHIYLDQLNFKGNAISLLGRGEMNFDHQLNLEFHAVVGRNEIRLPFVKNIVNRVGEQTMQMSVRGTLSDPQVSTQALPGINNLIQQIQSGIDITSPNTSVTPRKAERTFPKWPTWGAKK
ncbi:MAG: hypothetical protein GXP24_08280 [Planctomycetes bacterium]|nr:hypothetical protein [Planctomycetota bacterium]